MALFSRTRINTITSKIIGGAIEVHRRFGPGLFESVYDQCLAWELKDRGLRFLRQEPVLLNYKGKDLDAAFVLDFIVEELVVVELKCVAEIAPVHEAQLLTYVKLTDAPIGLLLNFYVPVLKNGGIKRKINDNHVLVDEFNPVDRQKYKDWIRQQKK